MNIGAEECRYSSSMRRKIENAVWLRLLKGYNREGGIPKYQSRDMS